MEKFILKLSMLFLSISHISIAAPGDGNDIFNQLENLEAESTLDELIKDSNDAKTKIIIFAYYSPDTDDQIREIAALFLEQSKELDNLHFIFYKFHVSSAGLTKNNRQLNVWSVATQVHTPITLNELPSVVICDTKGNANYKHVKSPEDLMNFIKPLHSIYAKFDIIDTDDELTNAINKWKEHESKLAVFAYEIGTETQNEEYAREFFDSNQFNNLHFMFYPHPAGSVDLSKINERAIAANTGKNKYKLYRINALPSLLLWKSTGEMRIVEEITKQGQITRYINEISKGESKFTKGKEVAKKDENTATDSETQLDLDSKIAEIYSEFDTIQSDAEITETLATIKNSNLAVLAYEAGKEKENIEKAETFVEQSSRFRNIHYLYYKYPAGTTDFTEINARVDRANTKNSRTRVFHVNGLPSLWLWRNTGQFKLAERIILKTQIGSFLSQVFRTEKIAKGRIPTKTLTAGSKPIAPKEKVELLDKQDQNKKKIGEGQQDGHSTKRQKTSEEDR